MRLLETTWQNRNDFNGIFECEFCHSTQFHNGCYDDWYFFNKVVPAIKCVKCGRQGDDTLTEERAGTAIPVKRKIVPKEVWVKEE